MIYQRTLGACLLGLLLTGGDCYDKDDYRRSPTDPSAPVGLRLSIEGLETALPSDGTSTLTLLAVVDRDAGGGKRSVKLTTTAGELIGPAAPASSQTVEADARGEARTVLRSGTTPTIARVTAEVSLGEGKGKLTDSLTVPFLQAEVQRIVVNLDKFSVKNTLDDTLTVTALLTYPGGKPAPGLMAALRVTDSTGREVGRFRESRYVSDTEGKVLAHYSPAGQASLGMATVHVTAEGSPVTATARFEIVAP